MRNYIIGLLIVVILLLGSVVYKQQNTKVCEHFPIPENLMNKSTEPPFYLFLFFNKGNCPSYLSEIIEVLNTLPSQFCPAGVVPNEELKDEKELRRSTGFAFPLYSFQKYKKYLPAYTPTLFGVSPSGKIIFILPGIEGQKDSLGNTIRSIYGKLYPSFEKESIPMDNDNEKKRR